MEPGRSELRRSAAPRCFVSVDRLLPCQTRACRLQCASEPLLSASCLASAIILPCRSPLSVRHVHVAKGIQLTLYCLFDLRQRRCLFRLRLALDRRGRLGLRRCLGGGRGRWCWCLPRSRSRRVGFNRGGLGCPGGCGGGGGLLLLLLLLLLLVLLAALEYAFEGLLDLGERVGCCAALVSWVIGFGSAGALQRV